MKRIKSGVILVFALALLVANPSWSGAFSIEKQKEALLQGEALQTKRQEKEVIREVKDLASRMKLSAVNKDWAEYCENLSSYSQYNLALHYNKEKTKTCLAAIEGNESLSSSIELQGRVIRLISVIPSSKKTALVTVISDGQQLDFVALKEQGLWKADLHPPINMSQYENVQEKVGKGYSENYNDLLNTKTSKVDKEIYIPSGACLQAFLIKPVRNEISVRLNDQVTSPLAARLGL